MTPIVFFVLVATLILGVLLIAIGRIGRKINKHPVCRSCGFDLDGVYPASVTCPECGAGLKRAGGVRIGARKRLHVLTAIGALVAALPITPIALVLYASITGADINKYKPLGLLLWEAPRTMGPRSVAIAEELHSRMQAKQLDSTQESRIVDLALELQGNPSFAWSESWGDVVERAQMNNRAGAEQLKKFRNQAGVLAIEPRPRVRIGDSVPVVISLKESRTAAGSSIIAIITCGKVSIAGKPATGAKPKRPSVMGALLGGWLDMFGGNSGQIRQATAILTGSKSNMGRGMQANELATWSFTVPEGLAPGKHRISAELFIQANDWGMNTTSWGDTTKKTSENRAIVLEAQFELVAADAESFEVVAANEKLAEELATALRPQHAMLMASWNPRQRDSAMLQMVCSTATVPVDVAFEVFAVAADGEEYPLGWLTSGRGGYSHMSMMSFSPGQSMRTISGPAGDLKKKKTKRIDLLLRPSLDLARQTVDLTKVYGGEVRIKDINLTENDMSQFVAPSDDETESKIPDADPTGSTEPR